MDVTDDGAYANLRLKEARQAAGTVAEGRWITAAVYTTLDHLLYLDYLLGHFTKGRQKPAIRGILRLGACQILYLRVPAAAACNESVKLAKEIGKGALSGYINGVLRSVARAWEENRLPLPPSEPPALRMSIQYSWPQWLVEEWISRYGEAFAEEMLKASAQPGMSLRPQWPYKPEALAQWLQERKVEYRQGKWDPNCFLLSKGLDVTQEPLFQQGKVALQGESAMLVCRACGVAPGDSVLDACAAPGGKTAYLASLCKGDVRLQGWELHAHRKELLDKTLARLGVRAQTQVQDAACHLPQWDGAFDVVLLDAPCSGLGVYKPDVRYAKSSEGIDALANVQENLLATCANYVKPAGALVYATCTISWRENQGQIERFLQNHPQFCLDSLTPYLPQGLPELECGMVQLFPHRDGVEGFFIARMIRCKT